MKTLRQLLLNQYNIKFLGTFINVLYLTMPIFGIVAYTMSAATMYATVVIPYIKPIVPWLSFWVFAIFIFVCVCLFMIFFWKFIYLSYFKNPIGKDVEQIKKRLEQLEKVGTN